MKVETTKNIEHSHVAEIDNLGNGRTISTIPETYTDHMHLIEEHVIKEFNEHSHLLIIPKDNNQIITDEYQIILNTGLTAKAEHMTPKLFGELNSLIISADKQINICIKLNKYDIILYKKQGFVGTKYLSLRNDVTYSNGEVAQDFAAKWKLNDKILIIIEGGLESMTELIFRLDK